MNREKTVFGIPVIAVSSLPPGCAAVTNGRETVAAVNLGDGLPTAAIIAALRDGRPGLPLPTAERDAAAVLRRLREAGWRVERNDGMEREQA